MNPPRRAHVQRAAEVLREVVRGEAPADQLLDALFRRHKEMGKRDRAAVGEMVYGVLRDACRLRGLSGAEPAAWLARWLVDRGIEPGGFDLPLVTTRSDAGLTDAEHANLPEDWHRRLLAQLGAAETAQLAAALREPAAVDFRVNTLKASRDAALARLAAEGVGARATPFSPWGLRLAQRLPRNAALLADGTLEPQDEGSQLLAQTTAARPGETVIDWCAGAGGKSLALAAMMQNQGRIIACDIHPSRIARIAPRAERAGATTIETHLLRDADTALPLADAVLVDAPCSGSGTLRRSPELRLKAVDIDALGVLQRDILGRAAAQVRPGGRLIYATCSLFAEENEVVVADFLRQHPAFEPTPLVDPALTTLAGPSHLLRLWPHRHQTDGFFAASLRRRA